MDVFKGNPKMMGEIKLTKGLYAYVSPEDFERVNAFKWSASVESRGTKVYAVRRVVDRAKGRTRHWNEKEKRYIERWATTKIRMHRFIMGIPTGPEDTRVVDHIDHDGLNNRRENLEIITQEENMRRSPGWKKKKVEEPSL
jgi:predicted molibdopterin-dependent oxidoreductase YjgC